MTLGGKRKPNVLLIKLQFPTEYGVFLAVNLLDLFLTLLFIQQGGGEANPFAKWFLLWGGRSAFVAYKVVLMLVVIVLCELVAKKRRRAARLLIWFGIVAVGAVAVMNAARYYQYMQNPVVM